MPTGLQKDIRLLHYRAWRGRMRRPLFAVWPIARVALAVLLRRKLFWTLFAASMLVFLMFFFGSYLLDWAETQLGTAAFKVEVGREKKTNINPEQILRLVRGGLRTLNGSQDTFLYFFNIQGAMVMIVLALAGSVLVGNDFTYKSMPFYMAKPLSRWHYILGKCLAVGVIVNLLTTLPALLLWLQRGFDNWDYFADPAFFTRDNLRGPAGLPLLAGILGYGLVLTVVLSIVLVATASWMRRTMPLIMVWTTLFVFCRMFSELLVEGLHWHPAWRLMDLWNDLRLVGGSLLQIHVTRFEPQPQPSPWLAALVLGGVCLLCLSYLNLRTRAVEIVK